MRPSIPSVIPAMAKVRRAQLKSLFMMRMTKIGIKSTLIKVRILGRFIAYIQVLSSEF
jgi:hypothetical protein